MNARGEGHDPTDLQALEDIVMQRDEEKALRSERTKNGVCKKFLHCMICVNQRYARKRTVRTSTTRKEQIDASTTNRTINATKVTAAILDMIWTTMTIRNKFAGFLGNMVGIFDEGSCNKGANCQYKHVKSICKAYEQGFCPVGDACPRIHKEVKACPNYMFGFCPNGPDCLLSQ